jgi:hypothetical protein
VQDSDVAEAAGRAEPHRARGTVRVGGRQAEAGGVRRADEERRDRQPQFVGEARRQRVPQDPGAAFDEESRDLPFGKKILKNVAEGRGVARADYHGGPPEPVPGGREDLGGAVHQRCAGAGEEAGGGVQAGGGGERDTQRVGRPAAGLAGGGPPRRADEQARVVGADRASADENRVGRRAQLVDLVQVLGTGQDQPVAGRVVQAAVHGDGAAHQRVRASRHGWHFTRQ